MTIANEADRLLEITRRLLRSVEGEDAAGLAEALADRQLCLDALAQAPPTDRTAEPAWLGELRSLDARILALAGERLDATRDEIAQIRSARATATRGHRSEPTARFVSQRA